MASSSSCCRKPDIVFHDDLKYCQSCGDLHDHDSETFDLACSTARVTNPFKVDNIPKQSSPYVYAPLEHGYFRLVELQPGEFESEMTVKTTANCKVALKRVRDQSRKQVIWIDAICIDQANVMERSYQVQQMQAIYGNASTGFAYIGEAFEGSDFVLEALDALQPGRPDIISATPNDYFECRPRITALLQHRWFHRVWCLQEISMANHAEIICGRKHMSWSRLSIANMQILEQQISLAIFEFKAKATLENHPLETYPTILRLPRNGKQPLHAIYSKSVEVVFNSATALIIRQYKTLDFMSQAVLRNGVKPLGDPLASWAIDWSASAPNSNSARLARFRLGLAKVEGNDDVKQVDRPPQSYFFTTVNGVERILTAFGLLIGSILATSSMLVEGTINRGCTVTPPLLHLHESSLTLHQFRREVLSGLKNLEEEDACSHKEAWSEDGWWWPHSFYTTRPPDPILIAVRDFDLFQWRHHFQDLLQASGTYLHAALALDWSLESWEWHSIFTHPKKACAFRSVDSYELYISQDLTTGISPIGSKYGDIRVRLDGASVHFILRSTDDHYILIGEVADLPSDNTKGARGLICYRLRLRLAMYARVWGAWKSAQDVVAKVRHLVKETLDIYEQMESPLRIVKAKVQAFEIW